MKKALKIAGWVVGALVLAVVAAAVALPFLIDPNDYKPQIIQLVKDKTGRELRIDGKIGLSLFPWLGLEFNQVSFSNAPGFGPDPMARIETAGLKVKLLPLLRREVEVDRIILAGLNLNLGRDQKGRTNWADLVQPTGAPATPEKPAPSAGPGIAAFEVAGVEVKRAQLVWRDAVAGTRYTLQDLVLTTGVLRSATPTPIRLEFDFTSGNPPLRSHVSLRTQAAVDIARQTLDVSGLALELAGLTLKGDIKGEKIIDAPAFAGRLEVPAFDLRGLLARLGTTIPTRDPKALASASLSAKFQASAQGMKLPELTATLDQSKLSGRFEMPRFTPAAYRFDLRLDQFDLDRYLAPPAATQPGAPTKPATAKPASPAPAADPFAPLRGLDAEGRFRVDRFKAFGLKTSDTLIALKAKDDNIAFSPIQTRLYGGGLQGNATLNLRGDAPTLALEQELKGVQLEPLLTDADLFKKFAGTANITAKAAMRGANASQWVRTLNGTAGFHIQDGVLQGIDLARMAGEIETVLRERRFEGVGNLVPSANDRTPFKALKMTAQVKDGVATSDDLAIEAAGLAVGGKGSANLVQENLDYLLLVNKFPIKVSGPFTGPKFRPDWNAIAKQKAEKRLEQEKEKLKGRQEELQQELKQKLDKRLKGLFK